MERAAMLLQEGQFSRAAKAMVSRGIDQRSSAARQEMEKKHPTKEVPPPPAEDNPTPPIQLTTRQVYEAMMGFKAGTAPGPDGLRAEHLKEAKAARTEGRGAASVVALSRLVNIMAEGKVPVEVTPYMCGGNLYAAVKKNGDGHRPVAVGNILRRLTSKGISYAVAGRASQLLRPQQFGVGVRGGCEGIVHATRATLEDQEVPQEEKYVLQVDLDNGFNLIDREAMFILVRRHFPDIAPWVEASYGVEAVLNFGEGSIKSTTGCAQGCPLSSLLFSLTLHSVVMQLEEIPGLRQNAWFLDDGHLVGTREALGEAVDILRAEGPLIGAHMSVSKTVVYCPHHDRHDTDPLNRGIRRADNEGIKVLGAPVGSEEYEERILEERLITVRDLLSKLHLLDDPHMEYVLLRSCFAFPKFAYAIRTVDCTKHTYILEQFDRAVKDALEGSLGPPLTPVQWTQASLPTSQGPGGGLGLRMARKHAAAAYLASRCAAGSIMQEVRKMEEQPAVEEERALRDLNDQLGDPLTIEEVIHHTQRSLSALIDAQSFLQLNEAITEEIDKTRLNCVTREGAGDWLDVVPSKSLGLHLRKDEFLIAVKLRLGVKVFRGEGECPMDRCRSHSDAYGFHAVGCGINGERISRHHHLRDAVFNAASQAMLGPSREAEGLLPGSDDRPADILIPYWSQGKPTAIDVSVVSPFQAAYRRRCSVDGAAAVEGRYREKMRNYHDRCEAEGIVFLPFVVDTFGGWQEAALMAIKKLGRQVGRAVGKPEADAVRQLRQRLAVVLARDNASMICARAPTCPTADVDGDVDD